MSRRQDFTAVNTPAGLADLAAALAAAAEHALDSEANSGFAYRERLCLLQFNVAERLWLVDLADLPSEPETLEPLRHALESPDRRTCLHGGEYDVALLRRDFGIAPAAVWDSQQAASLLGWEQTGYGRLVERICGVSLPKAHAYHDWARRPLAAEALRYALDDVRYLPRICQRLRELAREADLEEEIEIAGAAVAGTIWNGGFRPEGLWRLKGVGRLERRRLPVLAALYSWRDAAGREADLPPGRLLNNSLLLSLARAAPRRPEDLRRLGLRGHRLERYGRRILRTIEEARRRPPEVPAPPARPQGGPVEKRRAQQLRRWRREEARRRGVSDQAVLPSAALRHLREHGAGDLRTVPQLGAKRIRLYGDTLAELCG